MSEKKARYITTTIPYVNADPHVGNALEVVQADVIARYRRLMGDEVFFNTGADEHGQKIWEKAKEEGEDVQKYVDRNAASLAKLKETLNLSTDRFIRTTDPDHKVAAQELWKRCDANGDIYKKKYKGLYCVGCEKFLMERDLVDGKCSLHPNLDPVELEEENYFFKFSNYQKELTEYLKQPDVIVPPHRLKEAQQFVEGGLEDVSISREKEKLPWGVAVPSDDTQVMYVWFDALTNYISTLGWPKDTDGNYKKFWEDGFTLQMAGKDMIRFQSLLWQAMLFSAKLPNTEQIFYHGFINSEGQKMSKSIGNVISPFDMVEKYGTDATRYILLRHVHPTEDTDITWERMDEWYTANLVNGLGNLVARVMKMAGTHLDEPIKEPNLEGTFPGEYAEILESFGFDEVLNRIWLHIQSLDQKITSTEPFKLIKENPSQGRKIITECVGELYLIGHLLSAFLPGTSKLIKDAVLANKKPENLFVRLEE